MTVAGGGNQYVDITAPTIAGYTAVGVIALDHGDVGNMSFKKWTMNNSTVRAMVHNETSGQRTAMVTAKFLYL